MIAITNQLINLYFVYTIIGHLAILDLLLMALFNEDEVKYYG